MFENNPIPQWFIDQVRINRAKGMSDYFVAKQIMDDLYRLGIDKTEDPKVYESH